MFWRKQKEVEKPVETKVAPPPYRVLVRQTGDSEWFWAVQVRMLGMSRSGTPYYKTIGTPEASGIAHSKEDAHAAATVAYCRYEKRERWARETEFFTPNCEDC